MKFKFLQKLEKKQLLEEALGNQRWRSLFHVMIRFVDDVVP